MFCCHSGNITADNAVYAAFQNIKSPRHGNPYAVYNCLNTVQIQFLAAYSHQRGYARMAGFFKQLEKAGIYALAENDLVYVCCRNTVHNNNSSCGRSSYRTVNRRQRLKCFCIENYSRNNTVCNSHDRLLVYTTCVLCALLEYAQGRRQNSHYAKYRKYGGNCKRLKPA